MKIRYSFWDTILDITEVIFSPRELLLLIAFFFELVFFVFNIVYQVVASWLGIVLSSYVMLMVFSPLLPEDPAISSDLFGMLKLAAIVGTLAMVLLVVWVSHHPHRNSPPRNKSGFSGWANLAVIAVGLYVLLMPSLPDRFVPGRRPAEKYTTLYTHGSIPCTGTIVEANDMDPMYYRHVVSQQPGEVKQHWYIYSTVPFDDPAPVGAAVPSSRSLDSLDRAERGFSRHTLE